MASEFAEEGPVVPAEARAVTLSLPKISAKAPKSPRPASIPIAKEIAASDTTAPPNAHQRRFPSASRWIWAGSCRENADSRGGRGARLVSIAGATIGAGSASTADCSAFAGIAAGVAVAGAAKFSRGAGACQGQRIQMSRDPSEAMLASVSLARKWGGAGREFRGAAQSAPLESTTFLEKSLGRMEKPAMLRKRLLPPALVLRQFFIQRAALVLLPLAPVSCRGWNRD